MTLQLAELSPAEAGYFNVLSRHRGPGELRLLDAVWTLSLELAGAGAPALDLVDPVFLAADLGGARLVLVVDGDIHREALRTIDPGCEPGELPEPLRLALSELVFADLASALEAACGHAVRMVGCDDLPPERLGRHRVDLRLQRRDGARTVHASLFADARGLAVVAELAGRLPVPEPGGDADWAALPIQLRLDAGWTDMPLSDLRGLARGDIVLLDATMLHDGGGLTVRVDEATALKARLVGTTLVIDDIVRTIMTEDPAHSVPVQEPPAADDAAEPLLASLDNVNVRLTFDLGHRNLSLGELKALTPGAIFDLGRAPAQAVNVRANGALIGTGELISVADRIGVRIAVLSGTSE